MAKPATRITQTTHYIGWGAVLLIRILVTFQIVSQSADESPEHRDYKVHPDKTRIQIVRAGVGYKFEILQK